VGGQETTGINSNEKFRPEVRKAYFTVSVVRHGAGYTERLCSHPPSLENFPGPSSEQRGLISGAACFALEGPF